MRRVYVPLKLFVLDRPINFSLPSSLPWWTFLSRESKGKRRERVACKDPQTRDIKAPNIDGEKKIFRAVYVFKYVSTLYAYCMQFFDKVRYGNETARALYYEETYKAQTAPMSSEDNGDT